jgi:hypothetical protein
MLRRALSLLVLVAAGAQADGADCSGCHAPDELNALTLEEIMAALGDPGIPPHRKFAELSEEQVREALGRPADQPD